MEGLQHQIAVIKEKQVQVANANLLNPKQVVALGRQTGRLIHLTSSSVSMEALQSWSCKLRPVAMRCQVLYRLPSHKDFGYTKAWVEYLVQQLAVQAEYDALTKKK